MDTNDMHSETSTTVRAWVCIPCTLKEQTHVHVYADVYLNISLTSPVYLHACTSVYVVSVFDLLELSVMFT